MKKQNTWKKTAACIMSLALVAGMAPANVGGFLTRSGELVAHAGEENDVIQNIGDTTLDETNNDNSSDEEDSSDTVYNTALLAWLEDNATETMNGYSFKATIKAASEMQSILTQIATITAQMQTDPNAAPIVTVQTGLVALDSDGEKIEELSSDTYDAATLSALQQKVDTFKSAAYIIISDEYTLLTSQQGEVVVTTADEFTAAVKAPLVTKITLGGSFTYDNNVMVENDLTLDLNGQTLTLGSEENRTGFGIREELTITDSSESKSGSIMNIEDFTLDGGTLKINAGSFEMNYLGFAGYDINGETCPVTLTGGSFRIAEPTSGDNNPDAKRWDDWDNAVGKGCCASSADEDGYVTVATHSTEPNVTYNSDDSLTITDDCKNCGEGGITIPKDEVENLVDSNKDSIKAALEVDSENPDMGTVTLSFDGEALSDLSDDNLKALRGATITFEGVEVTSSTVDPTCTEGGSTTYSASVTFGGQTFTATANGETKSELGHEWEVSGTPVDENGNLAFEVSCAKGDLPETTLYVPADKWAPLLANADVYGVGFAWNWADKTVTVNIPDEAFFALSQSFVDADGEHVTLDFSSDMVSAAGCDVVLPITVEEKDGMYYGTLTVEGQVIATESEKIETEKPIGKPALSEIEGLTADKIDTHMADDSGESYWYDHTYEGKEFDIFGTIADGYGVGIFDNRIVKITSRNGKRISGVVLHSNWDNDTEYQMTATSGTFDKDHAIAQGEEVTLRDVNAKEVTISSNSQTWLQFDWITVYYVDALDETTDPEEEVTVPDDVIPAISQEELAAMAIQFATENNIQPTINIENQTATIKLTSDQVSALNGVASVDSAVLAALTEGVTVPIIVTPNTDGTYQVVVKLNDAVLYSTTYGTPTVDPVEDEPDETTAPVEDETTAPVEDETTAPVEDETTAPVEDETTAPVEDETTAPVEDETTAPVEDETTAPVEDETTAPVEDETDETTAPTEKVVDEKELSDEFRLPENAQEIKPEKADENGNQTASLENAKPDSASTISYDEMTITLDEGTMKLLEQFCGGSLAGVTVDVSTKIMSDQLNEKQATIFEMAQKNNSLLKAFDFTIKQNGKATNLNTKGDGKMFIDIPLDNVAAAMKLMSVYLDENGNLLEMKLTLYVKDGETYARIFTSHNSVYMLIDAESELAKSVVTLAQQEAAEDTASSASETETPAEETTEAPAEEATEAPAEETTEAPAEEATEAPTEAATEAPTEAATEAPTEAATEAPTEAATPVETNPTTTGTDLPKTGNNNPFRAAATAAAMGLTTLGSLALWKSGIFRKKDEE